MTPYRAPKKTANSAAQKHTRARFGAAQAYAAEVMSDPLRRLVCQKIPSVSETWSRSETAAQCVAHFKFPDATPDRDHRISGYTGRAGTEIRIVVFYAIAVASVTVAIRPPDGAVIESGGAISDHGVWSYRATANAPATGRLQLEVTARNRAHAEARQIVEARTE